MADLVLYLNLDQPYLALRRVRSLAESLTLAMDPLTGGSTISIEIRPVRAGAVAADAVATGNKPRLILSVPGPTGMVELARLNPSAFSLITESGATVGWSATLALTSAALVAFFSDGAQQKLSTLKITLVGTGNVLKPLYLVSTTILAGYLAPEADAAANQVAAVAFVPLPSITGLVGGSATDLDGVDCELLPDGYTVLLSFGGLPQTFQLTAGTAVTDVEATPVTVRIKDYDAGTNARYWLQLS